MVFIDLAKEFDIVNCDGLWTTLQRLGCPERFVSNTKSFHEGILAKLYERGELSDTIPVTSGSKKVCVRAPTLFSIVFSYILPDAFKDTDKGVYTPFRTEGGPLNLRRLQSRTKILRMLIHDLLYAACTAERFGLTVSTKKTEVMYQPSSRQLHSDTVVTVNNTTLMSFDKFCYLGSILSNSSTIDDEIVQRIAKEG